MRRIGFVIRLLSLCLLGFRFITFIATGLHVNWC